MSSALEKTVEDFLDAKVRARGGFTVKLNPHNNVGIPDRLVVLPGHVVFVETKRPRGGRVAKLQKWWQSRFLALGHGSYIVKSRDQVLDLLASLGVSDADL